MPAKANDTAKPTARTWADMVPGGAWLFRCIAAPVAGACRDHYRSSIYPASRLSTVCPLPHWRGFGFSWLDGYVLHDQCACPCLRSHYPPPGKVTISLPFVHLQVLSKRPWRVPRTVSTASFTMVGKNLTWRRLQHAACCDRDYHCNAHCNAHCHSPTIAGPKRGDWLCEACEPPHPPLLQPSSPPTSPL